MGYVSQTDAKNVLTPVSAAAMNVPMLAVTWAAEAGASITHQAMNASAAHPAMVLRLAPFLAEALGETPDSAKPGGVR